ncbi:MAG: VWA domain-containing protein [Pseudomonadota bacterium]
MAGRPPSNLLRLVEPETGRLPPGSPLDAVGEHASKAFPGPLLARWLRQARMLERVGLAGGILVSYQRYSPTIAEALTPDVAFNFVETVKDVAFTAGRQAAIQLCAAGAFAANRLNDADAFSDWSRLITDTAEQAPESVQAILERMEMLLRRLDLPGFENWIATGIRVGGAEAERRLQFFTFADPLAERALLRETGDALFADRERRLRCFATALWGQETVVREHALQANGLSPRRASFDGNFVRVPPSYPGVRGGAAEALYRASLAHVAAHMRFGSGRFDPGTLKPMQIALVSLVEDARVEWLAMEILPGLKNLWQPYHLAQAGTGLTAELMLPRLARALMDPSFEDDDAWVAKGRALFFDRRADLNDPATSRRIGNLLGNDLGQMRVQFNSRTYVVEPAYRDDNLGLWAYESADEEARESLEEVVESLRLERSDTQSSKNQSQAPDESEAQPQKVNPETLPDEAGVPIARLPEWDYAASRLRPQFVTIWDWPHKPGAGDWVSLVLQRRRDLLGRIDALVRAAKVSRPLRLKRQREGDQLDLDACIEADISRRQGREPEQGLYTKTERRHRDLSVLLLLDSSQSTADRVQGSTLSVLQVEKEATALLAHAMDALGDPFALHSFSSNGREEVRYMRLKDFDQPYDEAAQAALAGLESGLSTRLGAAMRHAGGLLAQEDSHRRLLMLVTDGEPSDIDVTDSRYLIEDARKAVQALAMQGIDCFCVGLESGADSALARIFGRANSLTIDRLEHLPARLPHLYFRLTK